MKPFYKSKKFWTAIVTAAATVAAYVYQDEKLATLLMTIGSVLIGGFGLEDHGKAKSIVTDRLIADYAERDSEEPDEDEEQEDDE